MSKSCNNRVSRCIFLVKNAVRWALLVVSKSRVLVLSEGQGCEEREVAAEDARVSGGLAKCKSAGI